MFPITRLRRTRGSESLRRMLSETKLNSEDLIYPLFICPGVGQRRAVASMPGVYQLSVDQLPAEAAELKALGVPAVLLFGLPEHKDERGEVSCDEHGPVQEAVRCLKDSHPDLVVITDVCLCEYTTHGHCGVLLPDGTVENDSTLEILARQAVSHARAGADIVAPSDMMDGRVGCIRQALDENGFTQAVIMSYAAKYASSFYGPFREAAECAPKSGNRRSYQMDAANIREALREVEQDILEGADIVMVKPALAYLDVIAAVKEEFWLPVAAYNVSGEYAMIKAAAEKGWLDETAVMMETLLSMKRAGADLIITYFAKDAAKNLRHIGQA
ncbi:MAG: porphobilinogen synthase [Syntrophomonadaceae bacterium]|nr:porphobilinogen synthase [Syntrophomonadaceae bacterium]